MGHTIGIALVILFLVGLAVASSLDGGSYEPGEGDSLDRHRMYGNYRVLYNDGKLSQPFGRKTAQDYAEMFGGTVVPKDYQR